MATTSYYYCYYYYYYYYYLLSPKASYLFRIPEHFFWSYLPKNKETRRFRVLTKAWANPFLEKIKQINVATMKNQYFYCLKGLLFYLEHPEMLKDLFPVSVSSLNFSSAGTSWGKRGSGVRDVALLSLGNLGAKFSETSFPHFKTYFTQICRCHL